MKKTSTDEYNPMLDKFDHVVVLMLENRSLDNLLGYLYPGGVPAHAPLGKTFEGVVGKNLSNPVPKNTVNPPPNGATTIPVMPLTDSNSHSPFPDPGETYDHVNTQLFNHAAGQTKSPWNLPTPPPPLVPNMQGFVWDYIYNFKNDEEKHKDPSYEQYKQIMECYTPSAVPVLSALAENFAVFDHWFCSVPSQTWCNRAFWNAGTSWGHVDNGGKFSIESEKWIVDSIGPTIFNTIEDSGNNSPISWKIYSALPIVSLAQIIHLRALRGLESNIFGMTPFYKDCADGNLPSYSFVEPRFITPHNDMHPSVYDSDFFGPGKDVGEVKLGELFLWQVYDALRQSPKADKTLLVITFDEHGGCYDHIAPQSVTPPDLTGYTLEDGFDFKRLGIRVPTIMVSSHIAMNTVVNTPMHHGSFMKTLFQKWNKMVPGAFTPDKLPFNARVNDSNYFSEVFTSADVRPATSWPVIPKPDIPKEFWEADFSKAPLSSFEKSIIYGAMNLPQAKTVVPEAKAATGINNVGDAMDLLRSIPGMRPEEHISTLM